MALTSKPTAPRPGQEGDQAQAIGRSRDGRTSRIQAPANPRGRPIASILTPGNVVDTGIAATSLDDTATPRRLLADKACDADHFRNRSKPSAPRSPSPSA